MKKLYSLSLLLVMLLGLGFNASALSVTFEWETPGSVKIQTGSLTGPFVDLASDQTSYTFETTSAYGYVYIYATEGYILGDMVSTDGAKTFKPVLPYGKTEKYVGGSMNSSVDGKTFKVKSVKLERNDRFTVEVENGLDAIKAQFASGYTLDLKAGSNSYEFNPEIDDPLTVTLTGVKEAYSITLNGTAVAKNAYGSYYPNINIRPNDKLYIRVYENEPKDCSLTFKYAEGMEGCLFNIRNSSTSQFIFPEDIVDNTIVVKEGNNLNVNFKGEDYNYSKFIFNGEDVTSSFSNNRLTLTITAETNTLEIEGAPKVYADINFTGYIVNPEGVQFSLTYDGEALAIGEGTAIDADMSVNGITLPAATTRMFTIPVKENIGKVFFSPKEGYYISNLLTVAPGNTKADTHSGNTAINAEYDGTTFYMVVKKLPGAYSASLKVIGENHAMMKGDAQLSNNWNNPSAPNYSLSAGESTISFIPGYNTPLSVMISEELTSAVYLDGAAVTAKSNKDAGTNDYAVTPYYPANESDAKAHSTITVYADGTNGNSDLASASLTENDGVKAGFFYSPVRHVANKAGQQVLKGTEFIVKPSTTDCYISYKGEIVHGYTPEGVYINGLNENGEYILTAATNNRANVIAVGKQKSIAIEVSPADGAVVKTISKVTIITPFTEELGDHMMNIVNSRIASITVSKGDAVVAAGAELGEPGPDENGNIKFPVILNNVLTEAGEYTINIPAGTFVEMEWSETESTYVPVANGIMNSPVTAKVTVDPNVKSPLDTYTISPASGSAIRSVESVRIVFPDYTAYTMFDELGAATISDGTTTYDCIIVYDWNYVEARALSVIPVNAGGEDVAITAKGTWTLTVPAGQIKCQGETNAEITAVFNIDPENPVYPITPVPGSIVGDLSNLTITFTGAGEAEYNKVAILLEGEGFSTSTTFVDGEEYGIEYTIQFTETPSLEGVYTLTIPAGSFLLDGEPCEEVTAKFTYKPGWKLTPAPGSKVEALNQLTIEFPDATAVEFIGSQSSFMLTNGNSYAAPGFNCVAVEGAAHPTFTLTMTEGAQEPPLGKLRFIIDEGTFKIDGVENSMISVTYTIEHSVSTEWTVSPEGTIVYSEYGINWAFLFDNTARVSLKNAAGIKVNFDGKDLAYGEYETMSEGNMFLMGIYDASLIKAGVLKVTLEAGTLSIGGADSPAIEYTWNVVAPKEYTYVVTPSAAATVSDLSRITVEFTNAETAEVFNKYSIWMADAKYTYRETPEVAAVEGAAHPTFELIFAKAPVTAGEYVLTLRSDAFTLDGSQESPAIQITYNFDKEAGVGDIVFNGSTDVTVVTIGGRVLLVNAPAAAVKDLPAGIYVINGVKTLIK